MSELALPFPHSPAAMAGVVAAHLVGALAFIHLIQRPPIIEPVPIAVTLVDAPVPLPQGDEPSPRNEVTPVPVAPPLPVRIPVAQVALQEEHKVVEPIEPEPVLPAEPEEPPPRSRRLKRPLRRRPYRLPRRH